MDQIPLVPGEFILLHEPCFLHAIPTARLTFLRDNVTYFDHLLDPIAIHGGLDVSVLKVEKLNTYTQLKKKLPSVNHAYTLQYTFYDWQSEERIRNSETIFTSAWSIFVLATLCNESFILTFTDPLMYPCEKAWRRTRATRWCFRDRNEVWLG